MASDNAQEHKQYESFTTEVKAVKDMSRVLRFVGTTATRDREGDELLLEGWDFKSFRKNPVVLWAHDYRSPPVGRAVKVSRETVAPDTEGWVFDVEFASSRHNPKAEEVYNLVKDGFLNTVSVGFRSLESEMIDASSEDEKKRQKKEPDTYPGRVFKKKELLELSLVPVPANPEALMLAQSKGLKVPDEVAAELDRFRARKAIQKTMEIKRRLREIAEEDDETMPEDTTVTVNVEGDIKKTVAEAMEESHDYIVSVVREVIAESVGSQGDSDGDEMNDNSDRWTENDTEIRFVVRSEDEFDEGTFRRIPVRKSSPRVTAVSGVSGGRLCVGELRFPVDEWTKEDAQAWYEPDAIVEFEKVMRILDTAGFALPEETVDAQPPTETVKDPQQPDETANDSAEADGDGDDGCLEDYIQLI